MKKILFALAACMLASTAAMAQPMPPRHGHGYERPHSRPHKVWVPAHREHGRYVRGHYVWRR